MQSRVLRSLRDGAPSLAGALALVLCWVALHAATLTWRPEGHPWWCWLVFLIVVPWVFGALLGGRIRRQVPAASFGLALEIAPWTLMLAIAQMQAFTAAWEGHTYESFSASPRLTGVLGASLLGFLDVPAFWPFKLFIGIPLALWNVAWARLAAGIRARRPSMLPIGATILLSGAFLGWSFFHQFPWMVFAGTFDDPADGFARRARAS